MMSEFITDDIEISFDDSDKEDSDEENSGEENFDEENFNEENSNEESYIQNFLKIKYRVGFLYF